MEDNWFDNSFEKKLLLNYYCCFDLTDNANIYLYSQFKKIKNPAVIRVVSAVISKSKEDLRILTRKILRKFMRNTA